MPNDRATDGWQPWLRLALIPPAVLLLIVGVWLPATPQMARNLILRET